VLQLKDLSESAPWFVEREKMEQDPIPPGHLYDYQNKRVAVGGICKDVRAKELPFVPEGEREQGFRHGDETERLA